VELEQNIEIKKREALILKYLHHCIDKFILSLIGRSFTVLTDTEPIIKKELAYLPENFTAAVAVEKESPSIILKKENNEFKYYGKKTLSEVVIAVFCSNASNGSC